MRRELRHQPLQLRIVKHRRARLVANERSPEVILLPDFRQEVRRDMVRVQLNAERVRNRLIDLVPCERLVAGDLERLADRVAVAHEPRVTDRKIRIKRQRPKRRAIALNDDRLALQHALDDLPGAVLPVHADRNAPLVIRVARPDDRDREPLLTILPHVKLLANDLVPGVLPVRIRQRRPLRENVARRRLVIRRRRTRVKELLRPPIKEPVIPLRMRQRKNRKITDRIKRQIPELR